MPETSRRLEMGAEINRLRMWLQSISDCWDARSELYTSDADMAANFADRARAALEGKTYD
jgi:hypothetical protein